MLIIISILLLFVYVIREELNRARGNWFRNGRLWMSVICFTTVAAIVLMAIR